MVGSSNNRGADPPARIPGHRGGTGARGRRSCYSHVEAGAWERVREVRPAFSGVRLLWRLSA